MKTSTIITILAASLAPLTSSALEQNSISKSEVTIENKANKATPYLLKKCVVSDENLGSMGDYISFVYKGQEIKVCCKPCIKKFKKAPKKYLAILKTETDKLKK